MIIVSACLLGHTCRYDGKCVRDENVMEFLEDQSWFPVCPEVLGGLSVPRCPCELQDGRVMAQDGADRTEEFRRGAALAFELAQKEARRRGEELHLAILKSKSPSCGAGQVYDGSFQRRLVPGNGLFARLLLQQSIHVITEKAIMEKEGNTEHTLRGLTETRQLHQRNCR